MPPFGKAAEMTVHSESPFNAEAAPEALWAGAVTPVGEHYVRGHGPVPEASGASATLSVCGLVERPLTLTVNELRDRFDAHEVIATLMCAGNRRTDLAEVRPIPGEAPWGPGAIGTARWRGARLGDLLAATGAPASGARHVALLGLDESPETDPPEPFGGSIPLEKARAPEVLLAWEMNGEPLPAVHGGPLRLVVPGYYGARSVKWLTSLELQAQPSANHFQATAYRVGGEQLGELPVCSAILAPRSGATLAAGTVEVRGYALAGATPVEQVQTSADGGRTWADAELLDAGLGPWAWRRWRARAELTATGSAELLARAFDADGNGQVREVAAVWNPKGYANSAWARVRVRVA